METIGNQRLYSFRTGDMEIGELTSEQIRRGNAYTVRSYMELAQKVAELQFRNRDFVLLFRGQSADYRNAHGSSLRPTIFRARDPKKIPSESTLDRRYKRLKAAETALLDAYPDVDGSLKSTRPLLRQQILRWSVLQHYEICKTPLLDVTHSLRIAASFASIGGDQEAFVFVLGVPNLSGAITASAEAGLQIVRLASICPPSAVRPHIQEGYLLGEYPELGSLVQKQNYRTYEVDFGRRLIAKLQFNPKPFWEASPDFPVLKPSALRPERDCVLDLAKTIKTTLKSNSDSR